MHNTWDVASYCKLPLDMQRSIVTNELIRKERCTACKGRNSVISCIYNVNNFNIYTYLTEVIYKMTYYHAFDCGFKEHRLKGMPLGNATLP